MTSTPTAPAPTAAAAHLPAPLQIGRHTIESPVVLAPDGGHHQPGLPPAVPRVRPGGPRGGGASGATSLYVSEMITSRALVERTPESMRLIEHDPDESPRSIQLYGVDPATVAAAVRMLVTEDRADHIDLNFGCPVPKVTRKGGGAALPWKRDLFEAIVSGAVREAGQQGRPGHRQDAQGHRRRAPHLPRRRAHRRAGRAWRRWRCTGAQPRRPTPGRPTGAPSPG